MEEKNIADEVKTEKQTPFMKRVAEIEKKIDAIERKIQIIISSLRK